MNGQLPERRPPDQFPNLLTGELIDRTDIPAVAGYVEQLQDHRRKVSQLIREVGDILIEHGHQSGTKTIHAGARKVTITGGPEVEWDVERLNDLLEAGLPYDRFNELVTVEQTFKINANVAKSIAASNPKYAEIVESAKTMVPKPERVRISGG
jgi:hypothetical protein